MGDDFLELAGDDIFGDVTAGGGSVWMASREGLIQVDPATMDATWHSGLAPGLNLVYAFDSLWVTVGSGVARLDPTSLEEVATIRLTEEAEGVAAGEDGIWVSQHEARKVLRIDPETNKVARTIDVAPADGKPSGRPMDPAVVDGEVWVAMGSDTEVLRIDAAGTVSRIAVEREVLTPGTATPEAVWFSSSVDYDNRVTRIDRASGAVTSEELTDAALSRPVTVGTGIQVAGTLWFPTSGGTMVAVDPADFDVLGSVPLHGSLPRKAVEYDDAVWIASEMDGSLERIPVERLAEGLAAGG